MNETLYLWTFKFHKVVRQQNWGAVEDFILPYSVVYLRIHKWKNYWNRSTFAKVIVKIKVARFLWPTVYNTVYTALRRPYSGPKCMTLNEPEYLLRAKFLLPCPSEHKPMKIFGEKEAWAYPGAAQIFWVPFIISGTRKATNFKFGRYIHMVHPNKSPLKIWEKRERGRIQKLSKFFEYPLLYQERVKLQTSTLARVFTGSMRKSPLKIWEKRECGRIQGLPKFVEYPYYPKNG